MKNGDANSHMSCTCNEETKMSRANIDIHLLESTISKCDCMNKNSVLGLPSSFLNITIVCIQDNRPIYFFG